MANVFPRTDGSLELVCFECERQAVCPITFQFRLLFSSTYYRLFARWMSEINPKDFGNVPRPLKTVTSSYLVTTLHLYDDCSQQKKTNKATKLTSTLSVEAERSSCVAQTFPKRRPNRLVILPD